MAATPGFKSQHQTSSAAPFPTPPTIGYTCQHSLIFPALLDCHDSMVWGQSSASFSAGAVPRGSCLPVASWVELLPSPWLKAWPQLCNISMKPGKGYRYVKWPCPRLAAKLLLFKTTLNGLAPCHSSDLLGWGHPVYYFFLVFPGHRVLDPITNPHLESPPWLQPVTVKAAFLSP